MKRKMFTYAAFDEDCYLHQFCHPLDVVGDVVLDDDDEPPPPTQTSNKPAAVCCHSLKSSTGEHLPDYLILSNVAVSKNIISVHKRDGIKSNKVAFWEIKSGNCVIVLKEIIEMACEHW